MPEKKALIPKSVTNQVDDGSSIGEQRSLYSLTNLAEENKIPEVTKSSGPRSGLRGLAPVRSTKYQNPKNTNAYFKNKPYVNNKIIRKGHDTNNKSEKGNLGDETAPRATVYGRKDEQTSQTASNRQGASSLWPTNRSKPTAHKSLKHNVLNSGLAKESGTVSKSLYN